MNDNSAFKLFIGISLMALMQKLARNNLVHGQAVVAAQADQVPALLVPDADQDVVPQVVECATGLHCGFRVRDRTSRAKKLT